MYFKVFRRYTIDLITKYKFLSVFILIWRDNHFFFFFLLSWKWGVVTCCTLHSLFVWFVRFFYQSLFQDFSIWWITRFSSLGQFSLNHTFIKKCNLQRVGLSYHFLVESYLNRSYGEENLFSIYHHTSYEYFSIICTSLQG